MHGVITLAVFHGRPIAHADSWEAAMEYVERHAREGSAPGRGFLWTATGKLMVMLDGTRRFTGWELLKVQEVAAA